MDENRRDRTDDICDPARSRPLPDTRTSGRERRVWSVDEAAVILGISRAHAYELVARNDLPHVRLGRRILIPVNVVDELLNVATG